MSTGSATSIDRAFIDALPKAELHLHIEGGTLEPELKLELARRNGVDIGQTTVDEVRATYGFTDLTSFLAVYYPAMEVLVTEQDFHDLALAICVAPRPTASSAPRSSSTRRRTRAAASRSPP